MKQDRLSAHTSDCDTENKDDLQEIEPRPQPQNSTRLVDIDIKNFKSHPLWDILVETARRSPLYSGLSGYIRDNILPNNPEISPKQLASKLSISIGEALVILDAIKSNK
ncbi:hypothetical protein EU537_00700 [Candidatus Thorarchaeota archaeon]|nr:MAG: hypothetical protein EU537_00700 [Candidatus Thorarchaeota archaeon]